MAGYVDVVGNSKTAPQRRSRVDLERGSRVLGENAYRKGSRTVRPPVKRLARHRPPAYCSFNSQKASKTAVRTMSMASPRSPVIQLCYVRLAVQQPQAVASFATRILGLQPAPNQF